MRINKLLTFTGCFLLVTYVYGEDTGTWTTRLDNGMDLILLENHASELAASVICIQAGSRTESRSDNGLSHLLEHLLFDGTRSRSRQELSRAVTSRGGYFNAFTRKDYVCFELVMPSDGISQGLELQADQLLNSTLLPGELSKERKVVCEEIARDINSAYSAADAYLMRYLFGNTGYGLPVIGNYHTVEMISRDEIMRFYKSRYVPNRMTAVVVGDFDPAEILNTLRNLYGPIPAGLEPAGINSRPEFPLRDALETVAAPVDMPYILIAFPAPSLTAPDALEAEAAVRLWAAGEGSILSGFLTGGESPLVSRAESWISHHDGFAILSVGITPNPHPNRTFKEYLDTVTEAVRRSMRTFAETGITEQNLHRTRIGMTVDHQFEQERFNHLARNIAHHHALGAGDLLREYRTRIQDISASGIIKLISGWGDMPCIAIYVHPRPGSAEPGPAPLPDRIPHMKTLSNGMKVIAWSDPTAPLMAYHMLIPVPGNDCPAGLPRIVSEMLDRGTVSMDAETIRDRMADHGIRITLADNPWLPFDDYYNSSEYSYIRMESLESETEASMELLRELTFRSVFPEDQFRKVTQYLSMLGGRKQTRAADLVSDLLNAMLFPDTILARPQIPSPREIAGLDTGNARLFHEKAYHPANCILSIVGNRLPEELFDLAESVFGSQIRPADPQVSPAVAVPTPFRKEIQAPTEQAAIRAAIPVPVEPEVPLMVLAELLSERIQGKIREERGMAYQLGASLRRMKDRSVLIAGASTRSGNISTVETDLRRLIDNFRTETLSEVEIAETINAMIGKEQRYRQRRINRAYYLAWNEFRGAGYSAELKLIDQLRTVTPDALKRIRKSALPSSDSWFWAVVSPVPYGSVEAEPAGDD